MSDPRHALASGATPEDHALAAELAGEAGRLLVQLRAGSGLVGPELKDEGDRQAHELLARRIRDARPDDGLLSEEGRDDRSRLDASRVWVVDPLDGTREFGEVPRTDWAVHVALAIDGTVAAGAVALPAEELVLATDPAPLPPPPLDGSPLKVATSRTRRPAASVLVAEALGAEVVPLGSAGAKTMAVVRGQVDAYAHAGGMYEWDSAAPVAVALAAGLHASRIDGSPLRYNAADPWLPDLLVCRPELADACLAALEHCPT